MQAWQRKSSEGRFLRHSRDFSGVYCVSPPSRLFSCPPPGSSFLGRRQRHPCMNSQASNTVNQDPNRFERRRLRFGSDSAGTSSGTVSACRPSGSESPGACISPCGRLPPNPAVYQPRTKHSKWSLLFSSLGTLLYTGQIM